MCPEIVPRLVKGHVEAVCPSQFSGELDEIPPAIEVENPVAFTLVAVFLDDLQRHVQQAYGHENEAYNNMKPV
jgi:hypothetical protein